jgi:hypothetical protein
VQLIHTVAAAFAALPPGLGRTILRALATVRDVQHARFEISRGLE